MIKSRCQQPNQHHINSTLSAELRQRMNRNTNTSSNSNYVGGNDEIARTSNSCKYSSIFDYDVNATSDTTCYNHDD